MFGAEAANGAHKERINKFSTRAERAVGIERGRQLAAHKRCGVDNEIQRD